MIKSVIKVFSFFFFSLFKTMADSKVGRPSKYDASPSDIRDKRKVLRFTFTLNNPTKEDELKKVQEFLQGERFKKFLFQKEVAPSTGTPHLQGVYEVNAPRTLSAEKKNWSQHGYPSIHLERAVGTWEANVKYVTKSDTRAPGSDPIGGEKMVRSEQDILTEYRHFQEARKGHWHYECRKYWHECKCAIAKIKDHAASKQAQEEIHIKYANWEGF